MSEVEEEKDKKGSFRNYVILFVICILCMGLVLYICKIYKVYDEEQKMVPIIRGELSEIYQEDLEHHILENPTVVLYMCTSNDLVCRDFEKRFIKLLKKKDFANEIVYLNLTNQDIDTFINNFNNSYNYRVKLTKNYPSFVLFEDGKIKGILQGSKNSKLTIGKVKQFLELNEIGEE